MHTRTAFVDDIELADEWLMSGQMIIRPEQTGLSTARRRIRDIAKRLDLNQDETENLLLAFGEALSNAYRYGCPDHESNLIQVSWYVEDGSIAVIVRDDGAGFDVSHSESSSRRTNNSLGCGICLMRASVDEVNFDFEEGEKVTLKKYLPVNRLPI